MIHTLQNKVTTEQLWAGFGNNFDNYCQVLCEFLDNSISNIRGNRNKLTQSQVQITIVENNDESILTKIEDTGTGIKNPSAAFSVGDCSTPDSTMNEHGFGFKHALAKADPSNSNWTIATKSECVFLSPMDQTNMQRPRWKLSKSSKKLKSGTSKMQV